MAYLSVGNISKQVVSAASRLGLELPDVLELKVSAEELRHVRNNHPGLSKADVRRIVDTWRNPDYLGVGSAREIKRLFLVGQDVNSDTLEIVVLGLKKKQAHLKTFYKGAKNELLNYLKQKSTPLVEVANSSVDDSQNHPLQPKEGAIRIASIGALENTITSNDNKSTSYSLRRRRQSNPILEQGEIRDEYRDLLENGHYSTEQLGEWREKAMRFMADVDDMGKLVRMAVDETLPKGKVGVMVYRMLMDSDEFKRLPAKTRALVEMSYQTLGTEWGREGVARRHSVCVCRCLMFPSDEGNSPEAVA